MTTTDTIYLLLPEIVLVAMATWIYVGGAFFPIRRSWSWSAASGLGLAALALFRQPALLLADGQTAATGSELARPFLSGPLVIDGFSTVALWGILAVGLLFVLIGAQTEEDPPTAEYTGSLLLIVAGLMITAVANDLVLLFLGLELVSIPTYVVLYLGRRDAAGQESTIKYFFLSILSSALLLYGFSFIYGVARSTDLVQLSRRMADLIELSKQSPNATGEVANLLPAVRIGLVLVLAGLGFRLAAVPFHFYAPDVYQGTSNANAGLLSTLPKIAGLAALVRILAAMPEPGVIPSHLGWKLVVAISILTMTVGNLLALWQDNMRRLLAYSSIAHAGYLLIGVAVGLAGRAHSGSTLDGYAAAVFYLAVYVLATTGAFAALAYLGRHRRQLDGVDELAGLARSHPWVAGALAVFMFSLSGIPPLGGFWGKFNLFLGALDPPPELRSWFIALAVIGVLNSAISLGYYLRVVSVMYFRAPLATPKAQGGLGALTATMACAALVLAIGLFPGMLSAQADRAGRSVQTSADATTASLTPHGEPNHDKPSAVATR